jgi:hypothetical protein
MTDAILDSAKAEKPFSAAQCLNAVARTYGKSPMAQVRDFMRLHFGPGRLSLQEYYQFRLFDDDRYTADAKRRFLGHKAQQQLYARHIPMNWRATVGDKIVFYALFAGLGFPVPRTVALMHPHRDFGAATVLRDTPALESYLRDPAHYPFFGKPVDGIFSIGVSDAQSYDADSDRILLSDGRQIGVEEFVAAAAEYFGRGYLLQERLEPHPTVAPLTGDRVSTVRLMVMLGADGPEIFQALWKIPGSGNIADNFWREGNMLAALDIETGHVRRVVRGVGPAQEALSAHPDTGARIEAFGFPEWKSVTDLCRRAANAIPGLPLQAWDIALCPGGPVLVEANIGGDVNLPQIASGDGIMDKRLSAFLETGH